VNLVNQGEDVIVYSINCIHGCSHWFDVLFSYFSFRNYIHNLLIPTFESTDFHLKVKITLV